MQLRDAARRSSPNVNPSRTAVAKLSVAPLGTVLARESLPLARRGAFHCVGKGAIRRDCGGIVSMQSCVALR